MTELRALLEDRRGEFESHFSLAVALENRLFAGDDITLGETQLSARHLLTIKSGLIIHLYNIVEATMSRALALVGGALGEIPPRQWSENALREWLREHAIARISGAEDARLKGVHALSLHLRKETPIGYAQGLRKPPGSWTDEHVATVAERLGIEFKLPKPILVRSGERAEFGDKTPLEFLAARRNAIAHGSRSFEEGANDLTLITIRELADVTLEHIEFAAETFQRYVDEKNYMVKV